MDRPVEYKLGCGKNVFRTFLLAVVTFALCEGCGSHDDSPASGANAIREGEAWSYSEPPKQFGAEFHVVETRSDPKCGPIALIAVRDLNGLRPWAYVWFTQTFLIKNRGELASVDTAPFPPPDQRPEPGCSLEPEPSLSRALDRYDYLRRAS